MKSVTEAQNVKQVKASLPLELRLKVMSEAAYTCRVKSQGWREWFSLPHLGDLDPRLGLRSQDLRTEPTFPSQPQAANPG